MFRQGDILLVKVDVGQLTDKFKEVLSDNGRIVLAYGETTGHAHALPASTSTLYAWEDNRLLKVIGKTAVKHEEHAPIALLPGVYRVIRQREYSPEAIRHVSD